MAGEGFPVEVACRVLSVSCAGFYAWRFRPPSARAVRHAWLTDVIREVHAALYGNYGAKRVRAELVLSRGVRVGHNAAAWSAGRSATTRPRKTLAWKTRAEALDELLCSGEQAGVATTA